MKNAMNKCLIRRGCLSGLVLGAWLGVAGGAQAQECRVDAFGINFGQFNPLANQHLDIDGQFRIVCKNANPNPQTVTVCIGLREGSAGLSINDRQMQSGGNMLQYQLYRDANRTQRWGAMSNNENWRIAVVMPANAGETVIAAPSLYGRILAGQQSVSPGNYGSKFVFPGHIELKYSFTPLNTLVFCNAPENYPSSTFADFGIEASVPGRCEIAGGPLPLNFGTVSGLNVPNTAAVTRVDVRCTNGTVYNVALDDGTFSPAAGQRRMRHNTNPGHYLDYDIYADNSMTNRWGSLAAGEEHQNGPTTGTGVNHQTFLGYGRVPEQTAPSVGTYRDRVILTVHY